MTCPTCQGETERLITVNGSSTCPWCLAHSLGLTVAEVIEWADAR